MPNLQLSSTNLDFDYFKSAIKAYLSSTEAWGNVVNSPIADSAIDVLASIGTLDALKILRAAQESSRQTAMSTNTVYAIASEQGIRLTRKVPGSLIVALDNKSATDVVIDPYSVFESSGTFFFNRTTITIPAGLTAYVTLYEGNVITNTSYGLGEDYSSFATPESDFTVSDTDVVVSINGTIIPRITDGIWTASGLPGFQDITLHDGRAFIQFGNSYCGSRPSASDVVTIKYAVTSGLDGNSIDVLAKKITLMTNDAVTGIASTSISGGAAQTSALFYKNLPIPTFGTFSSAVTKSQYIATALSYPGVVDAYTVSQREANPTALAWMNLVKVYLITSTTWSASEKTAFIKYMEERCGYTTRIYIGTPTAVPVSLKINVSCYSWASPSTVKAEVTAALTTLFAPRPGIIGYDIYRSDISEAIRTSSDGVAFFDLVSPLSDIIVSNKSVDAPTYTVNSSSGVLTAGTYYYAVTADVGLGSVAPANFSAVSVSNPGSSIALAWTPIPGAVSYTVYGRSDSSPSVLAVLGPTTLGFVDDGSWVLGAAAPAQSELPTRYVTLGNLDISVTPSTRNR